jgi:hypothetical protein
LAYTNNKSIIPATNPSSRQQIRHPGDKSVIPAKAGIHGGGQPYASMDPGLRRDDMPAPG